MKLLIKIAMPVLILVVAIGFASFLMMARPVAEQIPVEAPLLLVDELFVAPRGLRVVVTSALVTLFCKLIPEIMMRS